MLRRPASQTQSKALDIWSATAWVARDLFLINFYFIFYNIKQMQNIIKSLLPMWKKSSHPDSFLKTFKVKTILFFKSNALFSDKIDLLVSPFLKMFSLFWNISFHFRFLQSVLRYSYLTLKVEIAGSLNLLIYKQ